MTYAGLPLQAREEPVAPYGEVALELPSISSTLAFEISKDVKGPNTVN